MSTDPYAVMGAGGGFGIVGSSTLSNGSLSTAIGTGMGSNVTSPYGSIPSFGTMATTPSPAYNGWVNTPLSGTHSVSTSATTPIAPTSPAPTQPSFRTAQFVDKTSSPGTNIDGSGLINPSSTGMDTDLAENTPIPNSFEHVVPSSALTTDIKAGGGRIKSPPPSETDINDMNEGDIDLDDDPEREAEDSDEVKKEKTLNSQSVVLP